MEKIDLKKHYSKYYLPKEKDGAHKVVVPKMNFLMIDGKDAREDSPSFTGSIEALYATAYKIKFHCKKELGKDHVVMPMEGLWWAEDMDAFLTRNKASWKFTLMIMQPDYVTSIIFDDCLKEVMEKKDNPLLTNMRFEAFEEGPSVQLLHVGPYSEETENIQKIHNTITELGGKFKGTRHKHHEIYLNDFRKVDPSRLKTVIRQAYS